MKKQFTDVMIYVDRTRLYFEKSIESREYFYLDVEGAEEYFFSELSIMSEENYVKTENPEINREQFEALREKMHTFVLETKKNMYEDIEKKSKEVFFSKQYIETNIFNNISLN